MVTLLHRKDRIIITAIEVINEMGVQSLSTKRIASCEGIAESTVFKHFSNKNEILLGVLHYYQKYDHDLIRSVKVMGITGLAGVRYLISNYLSYYENYHAITAITQGLEEMRYTADLKDIVDAIIFQRQQALADLIQEARENGEVADFIIPSIAGDLIWSGITGCIRMWRTDQYVYSLVERGAVYLDYMIGGIIAQ